MNATTAQKQALSEIAMTIADAVGRKAHLLRIRDNIRARNIAAFTFEPVTLTDEQWQQAEQDVSRQLACYAAEV